MDNPIMRIFFKALKACGSISELQMRLAQCGVRVSPSALYDLRVKLEAGEKLEKFRPDVLAGLFVVAGDRDSDFARDLIKSYLDGKS